MASPLEGCVGSLRNSMQLLGSSINILAEGVNDFPRLAKVLQTTRVSLMFLSLGHINVSLTICDSTSNSSPNPICKPHNLRYFQRSDQKSTIFLSASKTTSTSSKGGSSR